VRGRVGGACCAGCMLWLHAVPDMLWCRGACSGLTFTASPVLFLTQQPTTLGMWLPRRRCGRWWLRSARSVV
jgi:hypothetical protein